MKYNESTPQRPDGERVIDAAVLNIDIPAYIRLLKSESTWQESDRNAITVYKTNGMQHVLVALHEGAEMPKHKVSDLLSVFVLEGSILFGTNEKIFELDAGQMINLHGGISHTVKARKESVILLTLSTPAG